MSTPEGLPGMDRAVDSIRVGRRHRIDLGDLAELCDSITKLGLLQPITISPDGTLICGARRLAAVRRLGHGTIKVWVRSGISARAERLLAEQHENVLRAPLTPTEAEALYRELKHILADDAARRQRATQFGPKTDKTPGHAGSVQWTAPGEAREQAAQLVTGKKSFNRLERVGELVDLCGDDAAPAQLRRLAEEALAAMDADGNVYGHYAIVKAGEAFGWLRNVAADESTPVSMRRKAAREADQLLAGMDGLAAHEVLKVAKQATRRVRAANQVPNKKPKPGAVKRAESRRTLGVHAFLATWRELEGWTARYDPAEIAAKLTDQQWAEFESTVTATIAFSDAVREARGSVSRAA